MTTEYRNPKPTVDIILRMDADPRRIVLIKRRNPPLGWALPGGFVNEGESLTHAAAREAREEISQEVTLAFQFATYSEPNRDPRQHVISTVFVGDIHKYPVGADDAEAAIVMDVRKALAQTLAFDHHQILNDYLTFVETGSRPALP